MKEFFETLSKDLHDGDDFVIMIISIPIFVGIVVGFIDIGAYFNDETFFFTLFPLWYYLVIYVISFFILNIIAVFDDIEDIYEYATLSWVPVVNTSISLYFVVSLTVYFFIVIPIKRAGKLIKYQVELIQNIKEKI